MANGRDRWRVLRWLPPVLWAGVIFLASSLPGNVVPGGFAVEGHAAEYAVFGVLLYLAARGSWEPRRAALFAVLVASAYGVTDELHQIFTPGRTPDPMDWLTDTVAASLAVMAAVAVERMRRRRLEGSNAP